MGRKKRMKEKTLRRARKFKVAIGAMSLLTWGGGTDRRVDRRKLGKLLGGPGGREVHGKRTGKMHEVADGVINPYSDGPYR